MPRTSDARPVNPLPPVVWLLATPMIVIELALDLGAAGLIGGPGAIGWRNAAVERLAFFDSAFDWMLANGVYPPGQLIRPVTYVFVHLSFTNALFAVVLLLALGKMVAEVFRAWAVLAVFFAAAVAGAVVYGLVLDEPWPLVGAFPGIYGLIGAFTFLLWVNLAVTGGNRYRAFTLIAVLLGIQLVFGALFGGANQWVADVVGFAAGFGLSFLVSPGGWRRAVIQIRRR